MITLQERRPPSGKMSLGTGSRMCVVTVESCAGGSMIENADCGATSSRTLGYTLADVADAEGPPYSAE